MPEFGQWLHDVKGDNTSAGCKICHKKIKLSSMGKLALSDYDNSSKDLIELKKVTTFFGKDLTFKTISLKQSFDPPTSHHVKQLKHLLPTLKLWKLRLYGR